MDDDTNSCNHFMYTCQTILDNGGIAKNKTNKALSTPAADILLEGAGKINKWEEKGKKVKLNHWLDLLADFGQALQSSCASMSWSLEQG